MFGFHRRTEFVLVGYRGKLDMYPQKEAMPTLITESSWRKHSVKPDAFYSYAESFGLLRVDIFARKERDGWLSIGDAITGNDILYDIKKIQEL